MAWIRSSCCSVDELMGQSARRYTPCDILFALLMDHHEPHSSHRQGQAVPDQPLPANHVSVQSRQQLLKPGLGGRHGAPGLRGRAHPKEEIHPVGVHVIEVVAPVHPLVNVVLCQVLCATVHSDWSRERQSRLCMDLRSQAEAAWNVMHDETSKAEILLLLVTGKQPEGK